MRNLPGCKAPKVDFASILRTYGGFRAYALLFTCNIFVILFIHFPCRHNLYFFTIQSGINILSSNTTQPILLPSILGLFTRSCLQGFGLQWLCNTLIVLWPIHQGYSLPCYGQLFYFVYIHCHISINFLVISSGFLRFYNDRPILMHFSMLHLL